MDCFFCKSPAAHPATGSEITDTVLACASCTREFWTWFRQHMRRWSRPGQPDFYAAAARGLTRPADGATLPPMSSKCPVRAPEIPTKPVTPAGDLDALQTTEAKALQGALHPL